MWLTLEEWSIDVLHCSVFSSSLHTWGADLGRKSTAKLVEKGGIIFGRLMGGVKPGGTPAIQENR